MGIHELMDGSRSVKRLIKQAAPTEQLFSQAIEEGMSTLKQDGIKKAFKGYTDMIEVKRVCIV
jgi:type II secretory ATPase GspE/PulE/Tfp pilus assembly ATPase PilB-like protein